MAAESGGGTDLLDLMLDASVQGGGWSDRELRDECFILFLAGHETTAETLTWVLAHVAADSELQASSADLLTPCFESVEVTGG